MASVMGAEIQLVRGVEVDPLGNTLTNHTAHLGALGQQATSQYFAHAWYTPVVFCDTWHPAVLGGNTSHPSTLGIRWQPITVEQHCSTPVLPGKVWQRGSTLGQHCGTSAAEHPLTPPLPLWGCCCRMAGPPCTGQLQTDTRGL
jgi:hypothetical protein